MKKILIALLIGLVTLSTVFAEGTAEQKPARPVVKIASNVGIPTIYKEGLQMKGYTYDLLIEAFNREGYDVEFVDVAFAGIFAGLLANKWDMAFSGIYVTKAREAEMDFTDPYNEGYNCLVSLEKSGINGVANLKGKKIATEAGTSSAAYLTSLEGQYGPFQVLGYDNKQTMFLDLENGRVDVLASGAIDAILQMKANPGYFKMIATSEDNYMIAGAVRPGDPIKDVFNKGMNSMKEDGTLVALYKKNLGIEPPATAQFTKVFKEPYVPTK